MVLVSYAACLAFTSLLAGLGGVDAQMTLKPVRRTGLSSTATVTVTVTVTQASCGAPASTTPTISGAVSTAPTTTARTSTTSTTTSPSSTPPASNTNTWLKPTPGTSFLWSLEQAIPANPVGKNSLSLKNMQVYDVDLFDSTVDQIKGYKAQGKKVVCYFSAGSFEDWRSDASSFDKTCYCSKGNSCKMDGWDEWWLDLNTPACITNVQNAMKKRLELAKSKGCDAVEPDNTDSYTNTPGWKTTITDQFNYLKFLSTTAHSLNLGIALKNGPNMIEKKPEIVSITDFVVIEECQAYNECGVYDAFVKAGKAAFQVEYERSITCSKILPGFFALSYSSYSVDYKNIQAICPKA